MVEIEDKVNEIEQKVQEHSFAWDLLQEFKRGNKRLFIILMTVLGLWFATIGGFVWYLNQYDFVSQDGAGINTINTTIDSSEMGVVNGADSQNQEE